MQCRSRVQRNQRRECAAATCRRKACAKLRPPVAPHTNDPLAAHRWALVVAHPGHELRAFHFLERSRPLVAVLTDGSGSLGVSRLNHTTRVLQEAGATRSVVYGRFTDREAYARLMARSATSFVEAAGALARSFEDHRITAVIADTAEGYNPMHDVCRAIAAAAVRMCPRRQPLLFEVDLVGHPDGQGAGIRLRLDDDAFDRKLGVVRRYGVLAAEAQSAFDLHGVEAFRTEFFRRSGATVLSPEDHVPHYERVGNERVRQGRYASALRYGEHVRPVLATLQAVRTAKPHALTFDPLY